MRLSPTTGVRVRALVLVVLGLVACWVINYVAGGADTIPPHAFYLPIFYAGARLGTVAAVATAAASGVIAGPLLPAQVGAGVAQETSDWVTRTAFFAALGAFVSMLIQQLRSAADEAIRVANRAHDLAVRENAFLQTVSNEIRSPLTVISGIAQTLGTRRLGAPEVAELLDSLRRAADRLERMCAKALAVAGATEEAEPEPVDLAGLVRDAADGLGRYHGLRRVRVSADRRAQTVDSRPGLLRSLVAALLENALKFSPDESPVLVQIERRREGIRVVIQDFGRGIDPDFLPTAFEPFTKQDPPEAGSEGLGLGLPAARRLADLLDCDLAVENRAEGGVDATVTFRRAARPDTVRLD